MWVSIAEGDPRPTTLHHRFVFAIEGVAGDKTVECFHATIPRADLLVSGRRYAAGASSPGMDLPIRASTEGLSSVHLRRGKSRGGLEVQAGVCPDDVAESAAHRVDGGAVSLEKRQGYDIDANV